MFATLEQALEAVKNNADSYKEVVAPLNGDKALAIMAVAKNGRLLKHCNNELRADLEVVYQACSNAPIAIMFADFYIKEKVIGNDGDLLQKLKILMDYKEVKEALEQPKQEQQPKVEEPKVEEVATTTPTVEVEPEAPAQDLFTDSVVEPNQEEQLIQGQIGEESQEPEVEEKVEEKKATNSNKKAKASNKVQPKGKKPVAKKGEKKEEPEGEQNPE